MKFKTALHLIFILSICTQLYVTITNSEAYPFSKFPMYRMRLNESNFFRCNVMAKLRTGELVHYRKVGWADVQFIFEQNECKSKEKAHLLKRSPLKMANFHIEHLKGMNTRNRKRTEKLIYRAQYWDTFTLKKINTPDWELIIHEEAIRKIR